jgi:hypothetical protein
MLAYGAKWSPNLLSPAKTLPTLQPSFPENSGSAISSFDHEGCSEQGTTGGPKS